MKTFRVPSLRFSCSRIQQGRSKTFNFKVYPILSNTWAGSLVTSQTAACPEKSAVWHFFWKSAVWHFVLKCNLSPHLDRHQMLCFFDLCFFNKILDLNVFPHKLQSRKTPVMLYVSMWSIMLIRCPSFPHTLQILPLPWLPWRTSLKSIN